MALRTQGYAGFAPSFNRPPPCQKPGGGNERNKFKLAGAQASSAAPVDSRVTISQLNSTALDSTKYKVPTAHRENKKVDPFGGDKLCRKFVASSLYKDNYLETTPSYKGKVMPPVMKEAEECVLAVTNSSSYQQDMGKFGSDPTARPIGVGTTADLGAGTTKTAKNKLEVNEIIDRHNENNKKSCRNQ